MLVNLISFFNSTKVTFLPAGKKLAGSIISEKLAACVNIVPGGNYIFFPWFLYLQLYMHS